MSTRAPIVETLTNPRTINVLLNSGIFTALVAQAMSIVQWNLEHLTIFRDAQGKLHIRRLTTQDTSTLNDLTKQGLAPPIMSMVARTADVVVDTAESAAALAQSLLKSTTESGLLGGAKQTIFGDIGPEKGEKPKGQEILEGALENLSESEIAQARLASTERQKQLIQEGDTVGAAVETTLQAALIAFGLG